MNLELGTAQLRRGDLADALDSAHRALDRFLALGMATWAGRAQLLRADVAIAEHKSGTASRALQAAEQLFTECGATQQVRRVWSRRAVLARRAGHHDEARSLWERMLDGVDASRPVLSGGYAHLALADLCDPAARTEHLAAANRIAFVLDARPLQVAIRIHQAQVQCGLGQRERAIELLRSSVSEVFRIEATHPQIRADVNFRSVADQAQDLLITTLLEDGSHLSMVDAWRCAAAAKAYSSRRRCDLTGSWSPEPDDAPSSGWVVDPELLTRLLAAGDERAPEAPDWTSIEVPSTALVEFHVLAGDIVAFVIRDGQVHARLLKGATGRTRATLSAWQQQVSLRSLGSVGRQFLGSGPQHDEQLLGEIYDDLFAPLEDLLDGEEETWHLVLHRHLHAVPFEALLGPARDCFGGVMPTVSFRVRSPEDCDDPPPVRGPLVLAVPDENAPLIEDEAAQVVARLGEAELHLGEAAGRDRLLQDAGGRSVVHVACHGVFRDRNPLRSAMRMGDGWVTAQDLLEADLSGSLIVLSACASGATSTHEVGPIGIAWACLHAGARAVVAAMWPVDDATARAFMERLYARLLIDPTLSAAMEATRAEFRDAHPDRRDWAAFRLFADPMDQIRS